MFDAQNQIKQARNMVFYRGTLDDLKQYLSDNPDDCGVFLYELEPNATPETCHPERCENYVKAGCTLDVAVVHVRHLLNNYAAGFYPRPVIAVTDSEVWATKVWGVLEPVPTLKAKSYLGGVMKTVQEGTLADAYKRALDTADTTAIYVSYDDIEAIHAGVELVCEDLEHSEEQLQAVLDKNNSTVVLVSFEPEDTLEEITTTVKDFLEGDGVRAVVSPHHEIVKAVRESFNDQA